MANTVEQAVVFDFTAKGNLDSEITKARDHAKQLDEQLKKAMQGGSGEAAFNAWQRQQQFRKDNPVFTQFQGVVDRDAEQRRAEMERQQKERSQRAMGAAAWASAAGGGAITGLGGLANPWALERFQKALADLGAVIGRDLLPYLEKATRVVRWAADSWLELPKPIREVIAGGITLAAVLGGTALAMTALARASVMASAALGMQALSTRALLLRGGAVGLGLYALSEIATHAAGASYGAAPRGVGITSAEGYLSELQVDAMKAGLTESQKQTGLLREILNVVSGGRGGGISEWNRKYVPPDQREKGETYLFGLFQADKGDNIDIVLRNLYSQFD